MFSSPFTITFKAREIPNRPSSGPANPNGKAWKQLPAGEEQVFTFDSATAYWFDRSSEFGNRAPTATGKLGYSSMQPVPYGKPGMGLRVLAWEIQTIDALFQPTGKSWFACAVLNESMEAPIGRLKGDMAATLNGEEVFSYDSVELPDQMGVVITLDGAPFFWPDLQKMTWYTNRLRKGPVNPPSAFWTSQACPDVNGGGAKWQSQWTPYDITLKDSNGNYVYKRYWQTNDPRNPPIGDKIAPINVADWYLRQTHSHYREGGQGFRAPWETAFWAAKGTPDEDNVLRSLQEYVASQVGCVSPTKEGFIPGRPLFLAQVNGDPFVAGRKYNLTPQDAAAPYECVLQEGRPQIGKSGHLFWECFGRDQLHPLEITGSTYGGGYLWGNGYDFEHSATAPLLAAWILYGDPLAARQLHHIGQAYLSWNPKLHSTRSNDGWYLECLADAHIYQPNPGPLAESLYMERARAEAAECWQARLDLTAYQADISVGYEYIPGGIPEQGINVAEATMQLGIALHAACTWYQLDGDQRAFWESKIRYLFGVLNQPGVIDPARGGIIQRFSTMGPAPLDPANPKSIGERLEQTAPPNYQSRNWLSAEGWIIDPIVEAGLLLGDQEMLAVAETIYQAQCAAYQKQFTPVDWSAWGQFYNVIRWKGWRA